MGKFRPVTEEINDNLNALLLFDTFLTAFVLFLSGYLILDFLVLEHVDQFYAIIPAVGYFVIVLAMKFNKSKLIDVEKRYPGLKERLRTAADSEFMQNDIVEALQRDVKTKLKHVELSTFFNIKNALSRTLLIVVLCFMIIFMNSFQYEGVDFNYFFNPPRNTHYDDLTEGEGDPTQFAGGAGESSNIQTPDDEFAGVAALGEEELSLELTAEGYELDIRDVQEVKKRQFDELFADDIGLTSAATYEENIPKEQQEIVNNYFKSISNG